MHSRSVSVIAPGVFNSMPIAQSLHHHGLLCEVLTTWPYSSRFRRQGVPAYGANLGGVVGFLGHRLEGVTGIHTPWDPFKSHNIQKHAIRRIKRNHSISVIYSLSAVALDVFQAFPDKVKILDRASGHISRQWELIAHEHECFGLPPPHRDQQMIRDQVQEYDEATLIIVPSQFAKKTFMDANPTLESKIKIVQFGQGLRNKTQNNTQNRKPTKTGNRIRYGFLGNLSLQKGIPRLLEAFKQLSPLAAELHLVGYADANIRPFLANLPNHIIYHGKIPDSQINDFYESLDVFVLPSVQEGFGLVIGEALSKGIPVLASANTGAPDLFQSGECGLIFQAANTSALKEALETALSPSSIQTWRDYLQTTQPKFKSWNEYGEQVTDIVRDYLSKVSH